jgi:PPE-repeat protein
MNRKGPYKFSKVSKKILETLPYIYISTNFRSYTGHASRWSAWMLKILFTEFGTFVFFSFSTGERSAPEGQTVCASSQMVLFSLWTMLTPFSGAKHSTRTGGGALCAGADGPRLGTGRSATWSRGKGSLPDGRTVRAYRPDGPRVRRGWRRSPAAPGSRSREGPHRGGEILGVV